MYSYFYVNALFKTCELNCMKQKKNKMNFVSNILTSKNVAEVSLQEMLNCVLN